MKNASVNVCQLSAAHCTLIAANTIQMYNLYQQLIHAPVDECQTRAMEQQITHRSCSQPLGAVAHALKIKQARLHDEKAQHLHIASLRLSLLVCMHQAYGCCCMCAYSKLTVDIACVYTTSLQLSLHVCMQQAYGCRCMCVCSKLTVAVAVYAASLQFSLHVCTASLRLPLHVCKKSKLTVPVAVYAASLQFSLQTCTTSLRLF